MKILLILFLFLLGCTTQIDSPVAGTETTNGIASISGSVGPQNSGTEVIARSILMTPSGDSIQDESITTADINGYFTFDSLRQGTWRIIIQKDDSLDIRSIQLKGDTTVQLELNQSQVLMGRIVSQKPRSIQVFIPGTQIKSIVDSNGFYQINGAPVGPQDIAIIDGQRINYLSLEIPQTDTVFIRDVIMASATGEVTPEYAPFESSLDTTLSVVPVFHSSLNEPDWYQNRDFEQVTYYAQTTGDTEIYAPSPQQILFLGNSTLDDFLMIERLNSQGYSVSLKSDLEVVEEDTLGMDLLYTSYSLNSNVIDTLFQNTSLPIIVNESSYGRKIGLLSSQVQQVAQSIQISSQTSPITEGFSGTTEVTNSPSTMEYGTVGVEANILASALDDDQLACIYFYDQGDALVKGVAQGKRIGFFASAGTAQRFNETGWKLFDNSIDFALNP